MAPTLAISVRSVHVAIAIVIAATVSGCGQPQPRPPIPAPLGACRLPVSSGDQSGFFNYPSGTYDIDPSGEAKVSAQNRTQSAPDGSEFFKFPNDDPSAGSVQIFRTGQSITDKPVTTYSVGGPVAALGWRHDGIYLFAHGAGGSQSPHLERLDVVTGKLATLASLPNTEGAWIAGTGQSMFGPGGVWLQSQNASSSGMSTTLWWVITATGAVIRWLTDTGYVKQLGVDPHGQLLIEDGVDAFGRPVGVGPALRVVAGPNQIQAVTGATASEIAGLGPWRSDSRGIWTVGRDHGLWLFDGQSLRLLAVLPLQYYGTIPPGSLQTWVDGPCS